MFTLDQVVPWGRSFAEYQQLFALTPADLERRILGCGDGPAAFNAEATRRGGRVVSCDPLYAFSRTDIETRIAATCDTVLEQTRRHADQFVWGHGIASIDELGEVRMRAMRVFLADYDAGREAGRYVDASLPTLPFADGSFDLVVLMHALTYAAKPAQAVAEAARVLKRGGRLLLSSLARHEHRAVVEAYGHVNLGFGDKDLRKFAEKAGLKIASSETVTRERRPPHFEVISLIGVKP